MLEFIACSEYFAGYDSTILQKSNNPSKCSKQVIVRMCNIDFVKWDSLFLLIFSWFYEVGGFIFIFLC